MEIDRRSLDKCKDCKDRNCGNTETKPFFLWIGSVTPCVFAARNLHLEAGKVQGARISQSSPDKNTRIVKVNNTEFKISFGNKYVDGVLV